MEIIATDDIQDSARQGAAALVLEQNGFSIFGNTQIGTSSQVITLSPEHQQQIEDVAYVCSTQFDPKEPTLVQTNYGVPSLFARVDCTVNADGIEVYETEERPAGLGITDRLLVAAGGPGIAELIKKHCVDYVNEVPVVLRHPDVKPNDDGDLFEIIELDGDTNISGRPVLVREEPVDMEGYPNLDSILSSSVATILSKGSKRHTLLIPELKAVVASDETFPDSNTSMSIKPIQGSKARGVQVYVSPADRIRHGNNGTVTYAKAERTVKASQTGLEADSLLIENFKPPIPVEMLNGKIGNMILRVVVLIHPDRGAQAIGGSYVARKELVVHGATNAINGAVVVE